MSADAHRIARREDSSPAGVWQLRGCPPNAINVYLVEDVLIDARQPARAASAS